MKIDHPEVHISFEVENCRFHTLHMGHYLFEKSIPAHSHGANTYEIHYIISGYGKMKINDIYYDLKPNTFYVNGSHVVHAHIPHLQNPICEYVILLEMDSSKCKPSDEQDSSVVGLLQKHPFWIGESSQNLQNVMQQIYHELDHQYFGYEECLKSLMTLLITGAIRILAEKEVTNPQPIRSSMIDTKSLIADDYFLYECKSLSLEGLANRLGLSPRQTERYLKDHYGKTFIQKKTESRMSTAALLLSDAKNSITLISDELGYSSIEHFSTAFKRYYNCSPSEYRKKSGRY